MCRALAAQYERSGHFKFRLPPGKYRARVYGGSYATLPDVFEAAEGAEFVLKRE